MTTDAYELPDDLYAALVRAVGSQTAADAALRVLGDALLLAGERRGLEKAAAWHVHAAYLAEREAECTHEARRAELELHAARERKAATAIRALTGGTP